MKKVSVIVPVYNAKEYLSECVKSILAQKKVEVELLLIDDGSVDGSSQLCEEYGEKYKNVVVLHQKNEGASAARNAGLKAASGEYIVFADADDYLVGTEVFYRMEQLLESSGADIAVENYMRLWKGKLLRAGSHSSFSAQEREAGSFRFSGFFSVGTLSYVWGKMYRRSFLENHKLRFGAYHYAEDKCFNFFCYVYGAAYVFSEEYSYVYRKNDTSVSYQYREDSMEGWMKIATDLQRYLEEKDLEKAYGDLVANTIFFAAFFDGKMVYVGNNHSVKAVRQVLKGYGSDPLAKKYFAVMAKGAGLHGISSGLWKVMIGGFSVAMCFHWYALLAIGIKILIDLKIDERLSDTGLKE